MRLKTLYAWNTRMVIKLLQRKSMEGKKIGVESATALSPARRTFRVYKFKKSQIHNRQQPCPHNWTHLKNNGWVRGMRRITGRISYLQHAISSHNIIPKLKRIQHKNEIPWTGKTAVIKDDIRKKNTTKMSWKIEIAATITHRHLWCLNRKTTAEHRRQFLQMFPTMHNRRWQDTEKQCKQI